MAKRTKHFHVRVTPKSNPDKVEVVLDLSLEEVRRQFVEPYTRASAIVINGKKIDPDDLDRIQIHETNGDSRQVASDLEAFQLEMGYIHPSEEVRYSASTLAQQGTDVTNEHIFEAPRHLGEPTRESAPEIRPVPNTREVFVVHGRNDKARIGLFDFLRAIDLRPLEWSDAIALTGKGSPYVGEVLDAAFSNAHAVVVLFTPDDEVRLKDAYRNKNDGEEETEASGQARPNVLFESGMALGRDENRTILVELGELRPFSDILGRHTVRPSKVSDWRRDLANRLKTAGCPVDLSRRDWETAGDFDAAIAEEPSEFPESSGDASYPATNTELPDSAEELLLEAVKDASASIWALSTMGGLIIATNNREFIEEGNARSEARWKKALSDLEEARLIEEATPKRESFKVTDRGFALADSLDESIKES